MTVWVSVNLRGEKTLGQSKKDIDLGRFLSLILRHNPSVIGIKLDEHGWADVEALLLGMKRKGKSLDRMTLERIVAENNKQRYSFNQDHSKIRANQGHSLEVDVELQLATPPPRLYHGTAVSNMASIKGKGIMKGSRRYVHLSADRGTAIQVGQRHGWPVVLTIDTTEMALAGHEFYLSANQVWLCEYIPWQYVLETEKI